MVTREELNRVVRAGDRVVAGGGNRCCHEQAVGALWVADEDGERWRAVPLPDGQTASISDLAAVGDAVHVVGTVGFNRDLVAPGELETTHARPIRSARTRC